MAQAEIGFIVVQIDGMGTSNRSKAFHDVAWKNLGDAGFPDRILWHKAVAAKYPWYDISRVGIYGGSAGGQNALGGLLFHPEFYKAAVSYAGCHDNRMDKIWWNEQWMGWPIGPQYSASSNVDNAHRLQGELLLIVGEMDTNVDPSSTMQVVSAADQKQQELRFAGSARREPRRRAWRSLRSLRRSQAIRLFRATPAGRETAGVEPEHRCHRFHSIGARRLAEAPLHKNVRYAGYSPAKAQRRKESPAKRGSALRLCGRHLPLITHFLCKTIGSCLSPG